MSKNKFTFSIYSMLMAATFLAMAITIANFLGCFYKQVVITKDHFDILTVLTAEDVEVVRIPLFSAPHSKVNGLSDVVGYTLTGRISKGQVIQSDHITSDAIERHIVIHDREVVSVLVDTTSGNLSSIKVGELVSVSKSGERIFNSVRVWGIDLENNTIELLVSAEAASKLVSSSIGEPKALPAVERESASYMIEKQ